MLDLMAQRSGCSAPLLLPPEEGEKSMITEPYPVPLQSGQERGALLTFFSHL